MKKKLSVLLAGLVILASGLVYVASASSTSPRVIGAAHSCVTSSNGTCTLAHDIGSVPTLVLLTPVATQGTPAFSLSVVDGSVGPTAIKVKAVKLGGGVLANASIRFYYQLSGIGPAPTTTTTAPPTTTTTVALPPTSTTTTTVPTTTTSTTPGGQLDLPRIPWNGGPDYYAQFPKAQAWTNPDFFPIAVWGATVESQRDVDTDKAVGINTYLEIYNTARLDLIRNAGMYAIHGQEGNPNLGSETVAWLLADEPEQFGQANTLQYLKDGEAALPDDGRMRYTNFTANMIWPNYSPGNAEAAKWLDVNDAVSLDTYWYGRYMGCDRLFYDDFPAGNLSKLTEAECWRPFNYGYAVDKQRQIAAASGKNEAVFTFVENGQPYDTNTGTPRRITPDQMAGSVWASLIHGARGVNYFNHSFSGNCQSSNNFRHPAYVGGSCYTDMVAKATTVNGQIKTMARVLNTQSYEWGFNSSLDTMLKQHDGSLYIFAMAKGVKGGTATGTHTLALPPGSGSKVEVLFENRTVPMSDGKFTDTFGDPTTYHIYKVSN